MYQWKINLDTKKDIMEFFYAVSKVKDEVYLKSGEVLCVSAKSVLGCKLAGIEWHDLICQCNSDIYTVIAKFTEE